MRLGEGAVVGTDLRAALPTTGDGIACLAGARSTIADPFRLTPGLLAPVLEARRVSPGVTIVDMPAEGPVADTVIDACGHVALVIPAEVRPAAAAARLVARFTARRCTVTGVVRHRNWSGLSTAELQGITHCDILTSVGTVPRLSRTTELEGVPERLPGPLATTARLLLENAGVAL